jgi:hypothetical protein
MKSFPLKIILFAFLAVTLISCDKDDDSKPLPVINTVTIGGDQYETVVMVLKPGLPLIIKAQGECLMIMLAQNLLR